ncbi:isochorismatase family protein [Spirosoma sp. SC4-14]|uniref:isochorismatase family protein n=1 Tax=Spirosoma sp. SC4-14 TaxID=3128900 RepID=UPI0030CC9A28
MITALDPQTALVLIDLQKGALSYPLLIPASTLLGNTAKLVSAFRNANLPVVIVTIDPLGGPTHNIRRDTPLRPRSSYTPESLELTSEIKPEANDILITKHTWSAFYETGLDEELKQRGITGIVLAGVSTSIGVESTARAASERGYNIAFAQDAITDVVASAHEHSLKLIFPRIGEVGDTDAIIAALN